MRRDMAKKLCERPRIFDGWGNGDRYERQKGKIRVQDLEVIEDELGNECLDVDDSGRTKQAMSRGRGDKILGENLAPLYRFLKAQVGRPWDKVYSEIREQVRFDSATQLHILQHMKSYVNGLEDFLEEQNGRIFRVSYGTFNELRKDELFVNPKTKLLCKYDKEPLSYRKIIKDEDAKKIDERTYYCKIDGIWHEVVYDNKYFRHFSSKDSTLPYPFEAYFNRRRAVGHPDNIDYGRSLQYEARMLPKTILKQEGLKNDKL